ncbi:hypothetical protein L1987_58571 [Smallanthus sonchifolius]|uniref:Uncharacterized protein n=1 Tax=Smallanthus sonchifolius TaxID=185202 RepID=A0ACB9DFP0_9ASTR|nr:hypothetical protein L1987_58571 [Smallanthus sonchifolius]
MNVLLTCEANVEENIQDNHSNNRFGSLLLQTCEDDNSSSSSSITSNDHEVEFKDDYYDLCSPGTVKDNLWLLNYVFISDIRQQLVSEPLALEVLFCSTRLEDAYYRPKTEGCLGNSSLISQSRKDCRP